MTVPISALKKYRNWLAIVLLASLAWLFFGHGWLQLQAPPPAPSPPDSSLTWWGRGFSDIVTMVSLLSSVISLIGLIITSGIAWRREKREGRGDELDNEKKELELEILRLDLARKRQELSSGNEKSNKSE